VATQVANTVGGDNAGGNLTKIVNNYGAAQLTGMARLIAEYSLEKSSDKQLQAMIETLEHYVSVSPEGDVRGLEVKLDAAGRTGDLAVARRRKHEAAQFVMKHQSSPSAQKILSHLLGKLLTSFEHKVVPLINASAPRHVIDAAIHEQVIEPAWLFLESNPLSIDHRLLTGFLYFLGGNCHLRWDPC
jgi:hypothetical protein